MTQVLGIDQLNVILREQICPNKYDTLLIKAQKK